MFSVVNTRPFPPLASVDPSPAVRNPFFHDNVIVKQACLTQAFNPNCSHVLTSDKNHVLQWPTMIVPNRVTVQGGAGGVSYPESHQEKLQHPLNLCTSNVEQLRRGPKPGMKRIQKYHLSQWLNFSAQQKITWGGQKGYAEACELESHKFEMLTTPDGLSSLGENKLNPPVYEPLEIRHLLEWRDMPYSARIETESRATYAARNNLNFRKFNKYARPDGLTELGERKIKRRFSMRIQRSHLRSWQQMTLNAKVEPGRLFQFTEMQKIDYCKFSLYANESGLTPLGIEKLFESELYSIKDRQLIEWLNMSQFARDKMGGAEEFAQNHNISLNSFRHLANNSGLTDLGKQRLSNELLRPIEAHHLEEWQSMPDLKRKEFGGVSKYALEFKISISSWRNLVNMKGLNPRGERHLKLLRKASEGEI